MNFCPKCGFETKNMKFCPKCGFELIENETVTKDATSQTYNSGNAGEDNISYEDEKDQRRAEIIQVKTDHYVEEFRTMDKHNNGSWNWCGCLFGAMWFAYRKMYGWAAIAFIAPIIVGIILGFCMYNQPDALNLVARFVGIAFAIIFGIMSNRVYKQRVDNLIDNIPLDANAKENYIKKNGGTSPIAMVIVIVLTLAYRSLNIFLT